MNTMFLKRFARLCFILLLSFNVAASGGRLRSELERYHIPNAGIHPRLGVETAHTHFDCFNTDQVPEHRQGPSIRDCNATISMLPNGVENGVFYEYDMDAPRLGDEGKIALRYPDRYRARRYTLPAAFRSGNCLVFVGPDDRRFFPKNDPRGPANAASEMYWVMWRAAALRAKKIVQRCLGRPHFNSGSAFSALMLGSDYAFRYRVTVTRVPAGNDRHMPSPFPPEGWKIYMDDADEYYYNLYEMNGTWSGPASLGVWRQSQGIVDLDPASSPRTLRLGGARPH